MNRNKEIRDPQSRLKALMSEADKHEIEIGIPIKLYFRAAKNLLNSMYQYLDDKDVESAYILASKFIILFVELLPKHPDYKSISNDTKINWNKEVKKTFNGAEKMKNMILEEYIKQEEELNQKDLKQLELRRIHEEEIKRNAERRWLEEQEDKLEDRDKSEINNLENFLSGNVVDKSDNNQISVDRSVKPSSFGIRISESNNRYNWRTLVVPSSIFQNFLTHAASNTNSNIETCGILCGKISGGQLILTTVVLPKQKGTSDSCNTEAEEELYEFVDQSNLITLGWIHTHPSQTAFLSSVDLHTQFSYQVMLPEAIAIVCSPKYGQNAFFSLTPDYGVDFIKNCRKSGFHPHPIEPRIFEESPHAVLSDSHSVSFCDMRSSK